MPRDISRTPVIARRSRAMSPGRVANAMESHAAEAVADEAAADSVRVDHAHIASTCPICCDELGGNVPVWNWPCACRVTMHLNCAVQLRLTQRCPACPQCRGAWPGASADNELEVACRDNGVPIQRNWQAGPLHGHHPEEPPMPAEPLDLVLLCCERLIALGIPAGSRRMTWAPQQMFEPDAQGCRRLVGWMGDWVCNCCGRTLGQDNAIARQLRDLHSCGMGTHCRLSIDFAHGTFTWMCGFSGPLPIENPQENVPVHVGRPPQTLDQHGVNATHLLFRIAPARQ